MALQNNDIHRYIIQDVFLFRICYRQKPSDFSLALMCYHLMAFQKAQVESRSTVFKPNQHLSENQNYSLQFLLSTLELKRLTYQKIFSYEFYKLFIL